MKKAVHIILSAVLAALSAVSCSREQVGRQGGELMVSLYIPGSTITRAGAGNVSPLEEERNIYTLQIWAFLSETGELISFKSIDSGLESTGLPNATTTRIGLPLSYEMFTYLSTATGPDNQRPKVDVYAVANASSAISGELPGNGACRDDLDAIVVNAVGGNSPLSVGVPSTGIPMSGVLKNAKVTGDYPVLNITTLKLTKAVSKIRFVFCQQGDPATETTPAVPNNPHCKVIGIKFDGGVDCQIAGAQRLFTTNTTSDGSLFDLGGTPVQYTTLDASITGNPLIPNDNLSIVQNPEDLFFRSFGHETELAQQYESRIDAVISADSQVGPIYLRETDKTISGTITYRTEEDGPDQTAHFQMESGDVFSRNHTWVVFACFVEKTSQLLLKVTVLPWERENYQLYHTADVVNVIKRFTVPKTDYIKYEHTDDGYYDITFWYDVVGLDHENVVEGEIIIATPVGGTLMAVAVPGANDNKTVLEDAIIVTPTQAPIYSNSPNSTDGRIEHCRITITIKCNTEYTDEQLEGQYIDLHFVVKTPEPDVRYIDIDSESIDYYRFILSANWKPKQSQNP